MSSNEDQIAFQNDFRGELVTSVGPLSVFRTATAFFNNSADGQPTNEVEIEHRYTVRVNPAWIRDGGVVAFELAPPCTAVESNRPLDAFGSLVEFALASNDKDTDIAVLVLDVSSTPENISRTIALTVRCDAAR